MQAQKKGRNAQSKKAQKGSCSRGNQEESNGDGNVQCSDNYPSDDDSLEMTACSNVSSASRKSSSGGGKARAGRGAATDPQSLYARVTTNNELAQRPRIHDGVAYSFTHPLAWYILSETEF